jgi:hypothetical protein
MKDGPDSWATDAGCNVKDAFVGPGAGVVAVFVCMPPPRCPPLLGPRRWRGGRFGSGGGEGSAVDMVAVDKRYWVEDREAVCMC